MKNLQEATERICELKGSLIAMDVLIPVLLQTRSAAVDDTLLQMHDKHAEIARTAMLHAAISDHVLAAFGRDIAKHRVLLAAAALPPARPSA
ncbi:hypothetical protein AAV94_08525 [Lampropedia cohaerens]|uniref:Uncharacterized protein n=2 Tax=Lampropedia cohaerens TaxID=1610491 RepID=A0A0U1PYT4_9BURK|nr:hypothetical protein AAV94_08525 [Lampropedia cohaerens]